MCPSAAARLEFVEEASISMCTQDHLTSVIDDAIIWIGSNIIQLKMDCLFRGKSGFGLFVCKGTENHKEFVIYCTSIVEKRPDNFLNAMIVGIVKELRNILIKRELGSGAIGDRQACVGRELWL